MTITLAAAAVNLSAAVLLGAMIGSERQLRQKMAGLRTNALVALGAGSFVVFAASFPNEVSPTRVAAQVVSGIGFLGAGIIFRDGFSVSGVNTAATLWCSAAVGMLAGHGSLGLAALVAGLVFLVNFGMRPVVIFLKRLAQQRGAAARGFAVTVTCRPENEGQVRSMLVQTFTVAGMHLTGLGSSEMDVSGRMAVEATIVGGENGQTTLETIIGRLSLDPAVASVRWDIYEGD